MILKERIALMTRLGAYLSENNGSWNAIKEEASLQNPWFLPEYIDYATNQIVHSFLQPGLLENWVSAYPGINNESNSPEVGIVMAGNLPLVGFHDFLAVFISGCKQRIKLSSKDKVLWNHLFKLLQGWNQEITHLVSFTDQLKGCNAYIATGSNNSARYFDYYFARYPHIIRRNRSSAAILTGDEKAEDMSGLVDDICLYFGLGCRNVTQLLVPEGYDFDLLKKALSKYAYHLDFPKYKNNYDYQLALLLLNKIPYQAADPVLLVPSDSLHAPISTLHYREYKNQEHLLSLLPPEEERQSMLCSKNILPDNIPVLNFGEAQKPLLTGYADGIDTLSFLSTLKNY